MAHKGRQSHLLLLLAAKGDESVLHALHVRLPGHARRDELETAGLLEDVREHLIGDKLA